ncbi:MAG: 2-oxo acid dehydrogenase subunit E2 [Oscillospiraceae bacterium]|nr:2-oxo acid dehydrogenase subunit E2 [Oscillospiraceae bacterium]
MGEKKRRRWGDRKEGRWLRGLDPYYALTPYIMKTKNDACNYFNDSVEISEADRYLRRKRAEGMPGLGMLHLFIAAYIRVVSQKPAVNRFVSGRRIYARNDIEYVMSIKKEMKSDGGETSLKLKFRPDDTLQTVYEKLNAAVEEIRGGQQDTSTDKVAAAFMKLPRFIIQFLINLVLLFDYFGLLPQALLDASPFHGSIIITDLGSLGIPPVYHHLYNLGNLPAFVAFGAKRRENEVQPDGTVKQKKVLDYTVVTDERICDGFYFAQAFKYFKSYLRHPEVLETPPETVVEDDGK